MRGVHSVIIVGMCCLFLLAGMGSCADIEPYFLANSISQPPLPRGVPDPHDAELLLRYYHGLKSLPTHQLQQELRHAQQATTKEPTRFDQMRLILLLSLPKEKIQDRKQARALLQDFLKAENAGNMESLYNLALLLQGFLIEDANQEHRYRLLQEKLEQKEEKIRRLRSGLKYLDGRHKQEQEWAASLEQQLENERGRAETLKQQLEAIKTIEKRLEHRSQPKETLKLPEQSKILNE